jgi:hypothetical protein
MMFDWLDTPTDIAAAIVTVTSAAGLVGTGIAKTIGRKWGAYRRLRRLAAHIHVDRFTSVLGSPMSSKPWKNNGEPTDWSERIWVDRRYYVQALSDSGGTVMAFSVTSRSTKFRPKVPFPNDGRYTDPPDPQVKAKLHTTRFAEVASPPIRIRADLRANRLGYVEMYYFGNPGNYQSVALSVSDAALAIGEGFPVEEVTGLATPQDVVLTTEQVPKFRTGDAPNTYTVSAPHQPLDDFETLSGAFGADANDVRVFAS